LTLALPGEPEFLAALDRALERAAATAGSVGVLTLRETGAGPAATKLASAALQILPSDGLAGQLSADRIAFLLPGFGSVATREIAERLSKVFPGIRVGHAAADPDRRPCGPADLVAAAESSSEQGRRRILVVEDDPELAQIIEAFLTGAGGFDAVVARDGAEALAECARVPPALVLLDLELPDLDGARLLDRIRSQNPDLPAIACSGKHPSTAAGAAFTAFFQKPFDMRALVAEIQRLLDAQALGVP
jgi:CheY-like chemotaxis protein